MKTGNTITDRLKPTVRDDPATRQGTTEKNYGWHFVKPFSLSELGVKRPKAKCVCGHMATVLSASHHVPQELWFACRHCSHTFYRTNETGARL